MPNFLDQLKKRTREGLEAIGRGARSAGEWLIEGQQNDPPEIIQKMDRRTAETWGRPDRDQEQQTPGFSNVTGRGDTIRDLLSRRIPEPGEVELSKPEKEERESPFGFSRRGEDREFKLFRDPDEESTLTRDPDEPSGLMRDPDEPSPFESARTVDPSSLPFEEGSQPAKLWEKMNREVDERIREPMEKGMANYITTLRRDLMQPVMQGALGEDNWEKYFVPELEERFQKEPESGLLSTIGDVAGRVTAIKLVGGLIGKAGAASSTTLKALSQDYPSIYEWASRASTYSGLRQIQIPFDTVAEKRREIFQNNVLGDATFAAALGIDDLKTAAGVLFTGEFISGKMDGKSNTEAAIDSLTTTAVVSLLKLPGHLSQDKKRIKSELYKKAANKLGIDPEASNEEAQKAYRKLAHKYHPDKVGNLEGMSEEGKKMAKEYAKKEFQAVKKAYDVFTGGKTGDFRDLVGDLKKLIEDLKSGTNNEVTALLKDPKLGMSIRETNPDDKALASTKKRLENGVTMLKQGANIEDVAGYLRIAPETIRRAINAGGINMVRIADEIEEEGYTDKELKEHAKELDKEINTPEGKSKFTHLVELGHIDNLLNAANRMQVDPPALQLAREVAGDDAPRIVGEIHRRDLSREEAEELLWQETRKRYEPQPSEAIEQIHSQADQKSLEQQAQEADSLEEFVEQSDDVVYHGTLNKFDEFDEDFLGSLTDVESAKEGFFFATNRNVAESYADEAIRIQEEGLIEDIEEKVVELTGEDDYPSVITKIANGKIEETQELSDLLDEHQRLSEEEARLMDDSPFSLPKVSEEGEVKEVILDINNPLVVDADETPMSDMEPTKLIKQAKEQGKDGVIIKNTLDSYAGPAAGELTDVKIVFNKGQITSAEEFYNQTDQTYAGPETASIKTLERLAGVPNEMSWSHFESELNRVVGQGGIKKAERQMVEKAAQEVASLKEGDTVDMTEVSKTIEAELPKLETEIRDTHLRATPGKFLTNTGNYKERLYINPEHKTRAGGVHYANLGVSHYFSHARVEDLPRGLRILEIQSDLFQGENWRYDFDSLSQNTDSLRESLEEMGEEVPAAVDKLVRGGVLDDNAEYKDFLKEGPKGIISTKLFIHPEKDRFLREGELEGIEEGSKLRYANEKTGQVGEVMILNKFEDNSGAYVEAINPTDSNVWKYYDRKEVSELRPGETVKASIMFRFTEPVSYEEVTEVAEAAQKVLDAEKAEFEPLVPYIKNPAAHLRTLREEVRKAALNDKEYILIPRGKEALEIEYLWDRDSRTGVELAGLSQMDAGLEFRQWVEDNKINSVELKFGTEKQAIHFGKLNIVETGQGLFVVKDHIKEGETSVKGVNLHAFETALEAETGKTLSESLGEDYSKDKEEVLIVSKPRTTRQKMIELMARAGETVYNLPVDEGNIDKSKWRLDRSGKWVRKDNFVYRLNEDYIPKELRRMGLEVEEFRDEDARGSHWWRVDLDEEKREEFKKFPARAYGVLGGFEIEEDEDGNKTISYNPERAMMITMGMSLADGDIKSIRALTKAGADIKKIANEVQAPRPVVEKAVEVIREITANNEDATLGEIKERMEATAPEEAQKEMSGEYQGPERISTKTLERLKGVPNEMAWAHFESELNRVVKQGGIKKAEKEMIRRVAEEVSSQSERDIVNMQEVSKAVEAELPELSYETTDKYSHARGKYVQNPAKYDDTIYTSEFPYTSSHFLEIENYFSHASSEDIEAGSQRNILEIQSDLFQSEHWKDAVLPAVTKDKLQNAGTPKDVIENFHIARRKGEGEYKDIIERTPRLSVEDRDIHQNLSTGEKLSDTPSGEAVKAKKGDIVKLRTDLITYPGGKGKVIYSEESAYNDEGTNHVIQEIDPEPRSEWSTYESFTRKSRKSQEDNKITLVFNEDVSYEKAKRAAKGAQKLLDEAKKDFEKFMPYTKGYGPHLRTVREEVRNAAEQGIKTLRFPRGKDALKIEGHWESHAKRKRDIVYGTTADKGQQLDEFIQENSIAVIRISDKETGMGEKFEVLETPAGKFVSRFRWLQPSSVAENNYKVIGVPLEAFKRGVKRYLNVDITDDEMERVIVTKQADVSAQRRGDGRLPQAAFRGDELSSIIEYITDGMTETIHELQAHNEKLKDYYEVEIPGGLNRYVKKDNFVFRLNEFEIPKELKKMGFDVKEEKTTGNKDWWRVDIDDQKREEILRFPPRAYGMLGGFELEEDEEGNITVTYNPERGMMITAALMSGEVSPKKIKEIKKATAQDKGISQIAEESGIARPIVESVVEAIKSIGKDPEEIKDMELVSKIIESAERAVEAPLIEEAKKYDTPEEFSKMYLTHGTKESNADSILREGFKPDPKGDTPKWVMFNRGESVYGDTNLIIPFRDINIIDEGHPEARKYLEEGDQDGLIEYMKENGYDTLKTTLISGEEFAMLPESANERTPIKTKKSLSEIWEDAQGDTEPGPEVSPKQKELKDKFYDEEEDFGEAVKDQKRGKIPWEQTEKNAEAIKMDIKKLANIDKGTTFNAETMERAMQELRGWRVKVKQLRDNARANPDSEAMQKDYEEAQRLLNEATVNVAGVMSEAGRALNITKFDGNLIKLTTRVTRNLQKTIKKLSEEDQQRINKLIANLDHEDPETVRKFLEKYSDPSFIDKVVEYYKSSLYSAFTTQFFNATASALMMATDIPIRGTAGAYDALKSKVKGTDREVYAAEAFRMITSGIASLRTAAVEGLRALKEEGYKGGARALRKETGGVKIEGKRIPAIKGKLGKVIRSPFRLAGAMDVFERTIKISQEIDAMAYRMAKQEGHTGMDLMERIEEIKANPPVELFETAGKKGERVMGYEDLRGTLKSINELRFRGQGVGYLIAQLVMPFFRAIMNFSFIEAYRLTPGRAVMDPLKQKLGEMTVPLVDDDENFFDKMKRIGKSTVAGEKERDPLMTNPLTRPEEYGRMIFGTGIAAVFLMAIINERIEVTGPAPRNKKKRSTFYGKGKKAYSFRIKKPGGEYGNWYSYRKMQPFASILFTMNQISNALELYKENPEGLSEAEIGDRGIELANQVIRFVFTEQHAMQGVTGLIEALEGGAYDEGTISASARFLKNQAGGFVPNISYSLTRAIDPTIYLSRNYPEEFAKRIPGQQDNLLPRRDPFGVPVDRGETPIGRFLSPYRWSVPTDDPIYEELGRLNTGIGYPNQSVAGQRITEKEYDLYMQDHGPRLRERLEGYIESERWEKYNDMQKIEIIDKITRDVRKESRETLFRHYYRANDLAQRYMAEGMPGGEAMQRAREEYNITPENSEYIVEQKVEQRQR